MGLDTFAMIKNPLFESRAEKDLWFHEEYVSRHELPDWAETSGMAVRQYERISMSENLFLKVPNVLCGGGSSRNRNGAGSSFRGKVYNSAVEDLTGISLYQKEIPNKVVKGMADILGLLLVTGINNQRCKKMGISIDELEALAKWFRVVADNDGIVVGSW